MQILILILKYFSAGSSQRLVCFVCKRIKTIEKGREKARDGQKRAAEAMVAATTKRLKPVAEGDTVLIPVPNFDRGRLDHRNLMGYVMNEENGQLTVGTKQGIISQRFMRNQIEACSSNTMKFQDINIDKTIPLRTAVAEASIGHGQGYFRCVCTGKCANSRCSCVKNEQKCNSHCHPTGKTCTNHD